MITVDVQDAKTNLSRCLQRVERGETIVICRRNVPVAELRPVAPARRQPRPVGLERGRVTVPPTFEVYLSAVSAWEIATKHALGRLPLPEPPSRWVPAVRERHGIGALDLDEDAALAVGRLPDLHRDPFDRMPVCQAAMGGLTIVTPDRDIARHPIATAW